MENHPPNRELSAGDGKKYSALTPKVPIMKNAKHEQKFTHWKEVIDKEFWELIESKPTKEKILSYPSDFRKRFEEEINKVYTKRDTTESIEIADALDSLLINAFDEDTKRSLWEINHSKITTYLHNILITENRVATKTELSQKLGLSRTTIHKHLDNIPENHFYTEEIESFKVLVPKMLMMLYKHGANGNISASKLFLKMMGMKDENHTQNNFIQINNTTITENTFQRLPPDKQKLIEDWVSDIQVVDGASINKD